MLFLSSTPLKLTSFQGKNLAVSPEIFCSFAFFPLVIFLPIKEYGKLPFSMLPSTSEVCVNINGNVPPVIHPDYPLLPCLDVCQLCSLYSIPFHPFPEILSNRAWLSRSFLKTASPFCLLLPYVIPYTNTLEAYTDSSLMQWYKQQLI